MRSFPTWATLWAHEMCKIECKCPFFNCNLRWDDQNLTIFPLLNQRSCAPKFFCPLTMFNLFLLSCRHCWKFICFGANCSSISKCCDTSIHCPAEVANLFVRVSISSTQLSLQSNACPVHCCYSHSWLTGLHSQGHQEGNQSPINDWFNTQLL